MIFFLIFVFVYYVFEIRNILVGALKYVYCLNNNFAIYGKNSVFHDIYFKGTRTEEKAIKCTRTSIQEKKKMIQHFSTLRCSVIF
jgi:hypothetical protein